MGTRRFSEPTHLAPVDMRLQLLSQLNHRPLLLLSSINMSMYVIRTQINGINPDMSEHVTHHSFRLLPAGVTCC